jgi:hypothetical protein
MTVLSISDSVQHASTQPEIPAMDYALAQKGVDYLLNSFSPYINYSEWEKTSIHYLFSGFIGCIDRKVAKIEDELLPKKSAYLADLARGNNGTEIDMAKFDDVAKQASILERTAADFARLSIQLKDSLEEHTGLPYKPYAPPIDSSKPVNEYNEEQVEAVMNRFSKYLPAS